MRQRERELIDREQRAREWGQEKYHHDQRRKQVDGCGNPAAITYGGVVPGRTVGKPPSIQAPGQIRPSNRCG